MQQNRHLDLGCGKFPRNPYKKSQLYGIDIRDISDFNGDPGFTYQKANLITGKIPFEDSFFSSVSAFDFFEHVPRLWIHPDGTTSFPFIELMNEIHRVLEPNGLLYALTPYFPKSEAFQDPTHVNFISSKTHHYFCGENPLGKIYGFEGRFECVKAHPVAPASAKEGLNGGVTQALRHLRKMLKGQLTHMIWELRAIK